MTSRTDSGEIFQKLSRWNLLFYSLHPVLPRLARTLGSRANAWVTTLASPTPRHIPKGSRR
jgi:hypothetical protein